jgi:MoxR-like ATPase
MERIEDCAEKIITNVEKVIIGKHKPVQMTVLALLCQGHLLIEDVPGVGKTMLARAIAKSIGCTFSRLQFTPDMLPSDVTGVSVFNQKTREFEFREGPVFAQIVLTDEINRATPKTQSALLEAMGEHQITVDGTTYTLSRPFLVLATQNPIEYEGTFPLPEAQLDRFMLRINLGYPSKTDEASILEAQRMVHPVQEITQAVSVEELLDAQEQAKSVYVDLALYKTAQAHAAIAGRDYVIPDDVKALAEATMAHRLIISPAARIKNVDPREVVQELLDSVPVPGTRVRM